MGGRWSPTTDSRAQFASGGASAAPEPLSARRWVSSYLVTLRMVGPADEIETNFSSDPPLSERDVLLLPRHRQVQSARGTIHSHAFAVGAVRRRAWSRRAVRWARYGERRTEDLDLVSSDVDPAGRPDGVEVLRTRS